VVGSKRLREKGGEREREREEGGRRREEGSLQTEGAG
jgi:hypothetical protein